MSIMYCERHNRQWDSDRLDECPACENEIGDLSEKLAHAEARVRETEEVLKLCLQEMSWALDSTVGGPVMHGGLFEKARDRVRAVLKEPE